LSLTNNISNLLELVDNIYSDREYEINISIPEFTCVCPKTGQPDFATIDITYTPSDSIVELKSLKLHLQQYRNTGIYHETVTNEILDTFKNTCKPKKIKIIGKFNARGGISTNVLATWSE